MTSATGGYFDSLDNSDYLAINAEINGLLGDLPYFYQVPTELMSADIPAASAAPYFPFRHALSRTGEDNGLGLRLYIMPPEITSRTVTSHLASSGLVQTGDFLLSFRQGTVGTGEYQHIQLGLTHTGVAVVHEGVVYNVDSPLDYSGRLDKKHYTEDQLMLHIIRPTLTEAQRGNLQRWGDAILEGMRGVSAKLKFATDYGAPKFREAGLHQVFNLGQIIATGGRQGRTTSMYCSEFAWTFAALRDCDLGDAEVRRAFDTGSSCSQITRDSLLWEPMPVLGDALLDARDGEPGLSDGIGLVLRSLEISDAQRDALLDRAFTEWEPSFSGGRPPYQISSGHREQAQAFAPLYDPLKSFFRAALADPSGPMAQGIKAELDKNLAGQENYSPTGFLVEALRPLEARERRASYIGTLAFPTEEQYRVIHERFPSQLHRMTEIRPTTLGGAGRVPQAESAPRPQPAETVVQFRDGFRGSRHHKRAEVKALQDLLITLGHDVGRAGADGLYGQSTATAVAAVKAKHGLGDDGRVVTADDWRVIEQAAGA